jgi:hypothetical protein
MPYQRCVAEPAANGYPAHAHVAWIDPRTGNGRADPAEGGDGHTHEIIARVVQPSDDDGHTHALNCAS